MKSLFSLRMRMLLIGTLKNSATCWQSTVMEPWPISTWETWTSMVSSCWIMTLASVPVWP